MLTKECIILHAFQLTNDMKLQPTRGKHLTEKYALLKRQSQEKEGQKKVLINFIFYILPM